MNRNVTEILLESAPVKTRLSFGVNTNIVLKGISNEVRKDKDGNKVKKNCYMTFVQVDPEKNNKILAGYTFSYFNLDDKYVVSSFLHQLNQLTAIGSFIFPDDVSESIDEKILTMIVEKGIEEDIVNETTKDNKAFREVQQEMVNIYVEEGTPYFNNMDNLLQLVVVTSRNGDFLDLPKEDTGFIGKNDAKRKLSVGSKYKRMYLKSLEDETADPDELGEELELEDELTLDDNEGGLDDI